MPKSSLPVVPKPPKKVKVMTEAQLQGIVAEVIKTEMHKFTANFME